MAGEPVHLYYFPASYYSQKVLIALKEKGVSYESTVVGLTTSGTYAPWFLKLNPKGQVPVLKIGDKVVPDSEAIIDVIDGLPCRNDKRLVPCVNTTHGQLVSQWRERLHSVPAVVLRFGLYMNKQLQTPDTTMPIDKEAWLASVTSWISHLESCKQSDPELSTVLDDKIKVFQDWQSGEHFQLSIVTKVFDQMDVIFDQVEAQLAQVKPDNYLWLCGADMSVADISLCVLIGRLILMGYQTRYLDAAKRPTLLEYWERAMKHPSVGDTIRTAVPALNK